jgi:hypothetical protein
VSSAKTDIGIKHGQSVNIYGAGQHSCILEMRLLFPTITMMENTHRYYTIYSVMLPVHRQPRGGGIGCDSNPRPKMYLQLHDYAYTLMFQPESYPLFEVQAAIYCVTSMGTGTVWRATKGHFACAYDRCNATH